jgi:hypothetical protein
VHRNGTPENERRFSGQTMQRVFSTDAAENAAVEQDEHMEQRRGDER